MNFRQPGLYWRTWVVAGCVGLLSLATGPTRAQATAAPPPPVADFFRTPGLLKPVLSPDGQYLAATLGGPDGRRRLVVVNLNKLDDAKVVAGFSDADIERYAWVNKERLVYSVADTQQADRRMLPGLWGVNRDGSGQRQLIHTWYEVVSEVRHIKDRRLNWQWSLHSTVRDGSADVIVQGADYNELGDYRSTRLARLDTLSGQVRNLTAGAPNHVMDWVLDPAGQPVAVRTASDDREALYLRDAGGEWQRWQEGQAYKDNIATPFWAGPDGRLLVLARPPGADTVALYALDRARKALDERPLIELAGYDFDGTPVYDSVGRRLIGWHFESDALGSAWLDAGMKAVQAEIDKQLPATSNRIGCERCLDARYLLVTASSDRQPPIYFLYDRENRELQNVGGTRPWIKPEQMGLRDMYRFKARDGLQIPVLVTQPPGKAAGPRPAVVLVHGGPWARGAHWEWEAHAQFLASRGYVVIEPEFRGSVGYGARHFRAGWKQWGLAMQDDVADATLWAVKQGLADPQRVCIAGASYGGYATLMGLVRNPELYRCGFQWVGVSDIELMYSIQWSDLSERWKQYGMPALIGDRLKDAQQIRDTSPVVLAKRIKRPLLMAYGGQDLRVPIDHGQAMRDALQAAGNKDVEWISYAREGHGWQELQTNVDFWTRVEKFLDRHIGAGAAR